jgi:hypothetical protein
LDNLQALTQTPLKQRCVAHGNKNAWTGKSRGRANQRDQVAGCFSRSMTKETEVSRVTGNSPTMLDDLRCAKLNGIE